MAAGSRRASHPRWQNGSHAAFSNLAWKTTSLHLHHVLVITQDSPIQLRERLHNGVNTGRGTHGRPSWRLVTTAVLNRVARSLLVELASRKGRVEADNSSIHQ